MKRACHGTWTSSWLGALSSESFARFAPQGKVISLHAAYQACFSGD